MISAIDEQFARRYLSNGMNASDAYRRTHPNASDATAKVQGCRVIAKPNVQTWLATRLVPRDESDPMTPSRSVEEMRRRAFADRTGIYGDDKKLLHPKDWPRELRSLFQSAEFNEDGTLKKVKLTAGDKALELSVKYHNLINEKNLNVIAEIDLGSMTDEEIDRRLEAIKKMMRRGEDTEQEGQ